jgi:hypothetical protein
MHCTLFIVAHPPPESLALRLLQPQYEERRRACRCRAHWPLCLSLDMG